MLRCTGAVLLLPIPSAGSSVRWREQPCTVLAESITSPWKRPYYQAAPDKHEPRANLLCLTCPWPPVLPIEYEFRALPIVQSSAAASSNQCYLLFRAAAPQSALRDAPSHPIPSHQHHALARLGRAQRQHGRTHRQRRQRHRQRKSRQAQFQPRTRVTTNSALFCLRQTLRARQNKLHT